jgi:hypothetical protein
LAVKFLGLAGAAAEPAIGELERLRDDPSDTIRQEVSAALARIRP